MTNDDQSRIDESDKRDSFLSRIVKATAQIEREEFSAVLLSFLFVFILMTAYSILKPVRDSLAGDWGAVALSTTWTITFLASIVAVSLYGFALSFIRFRAIVPGVYGFFALTFLSLYFVTEYVANSVLINQGFYVWVSVFSLFHLSVFWSFMSDIFDSSRAPRIFGFIAAGASVGAIVGPTTTALLVDIVGTNALMLVSASLLLIPIPIILVLEKLRVSRLGGRTQSSESPRAAERDRISQNPFSGFDVLLKDRYLLQIGAFIVLYVTISTFVYFELQDLTGEYSIDTRTKIWSFIDLATNALTLITAVFVTNRIVTKLGMSVALALMPGLVAIGILALVAAPTLALLAVFQVARRVGNYAVTRPSREMLYTVVDRDTRFKTKPVIDIVFYRGGDVASAWLFTFLSKGMGLGLAGIAMVISGVAAVWAAVAVYLGRQFKRRASLVQNGEADA